MSSKSKTAKVKPVSSKSKTAKVKPVSSKSKTANVKRRKIQSPSSTSESSESSESSSVSSTEGDSSSDTSKSAPSKSHKRRKREHSSKLMNLLQGSTDDSSDSESDDQLGIFSNPSTTHISKQWKKKIWNREYINLSKLYYGKESDNVSMMVKKSKANTVTSLNRAPQRQINNILSWCRAFQLFACIYTSKYPKEGSSMFQYMTIVQTLAHKGQNWLLYDQKFRQLRSKRRVPWSKLHVQIHLYQSLGKTQTPKSQQSTSGQTLGVNSSQNQGPSSSSQRDIFRQGFCWSFQRHGYCVRAGCTRLHKCSLCRGQHAGSSCTSQQGFSRQNNYQPNTGKQGGNTTDPSNSNKT